MYLLWTNSTLWSEILRKEHEQCDLRDLNMIPIHVFIEPEIIDTRVKTSLAQQYHLKGRSLLKGHFKILTLFS